MNYSIDEIFDDLYLDSPLGQHDVESTILDDQIERYYAGYHIVFREDYET